MTIDQIREPDDAELDAFLRGEDDMSPRLKRLSQPSTPPELTAAVMAEIETALTEEKKAAERTPPRRLRWAMPTAFAASVLVGVMIHTQWRAAQDRNDAAVAQAQPGSPARLSVPENTPAPNSETVAAATPDTKEPMQTRRAVTREKPLQIATAATSAPKPMPSETVQTVVTTGIRASLQQSLNVKRKAVTNVETVTAEDAGKMPDENVAALAAPAAAAASMRAAQSTEKAKRWMERIEKKIDFGEDRDALDEWERFRKAYPDFAVPEEFAEKIKALQQK